MNRRDMLITGYSLILLIGGVIGYFVAGSLASLLMSTIFAILLIGSLFLSRFYASFSNSAILSLLGVLALFFAYRWYVTKFFPSGAICILTVTVFLLSLFITNGTKKT